MSVRDDVLAAIREIAARELGMSRPIAASHDLITDLELDSITLVTMLAAVENRFQVRLPPADSEVVRTVQDIVEQVVRCRRDRRP